MGSTVPWRFSQAGSTYSQWLWQTRDFTATVVCNDAVWSWEVKSAAAVPISAGGATDFDTAADLVLEAVGKGLPDSAGYRRWTQGASHKYTLASGVRVDLSDGDGKAVRLTLADGRELDGVLHLGDWLLHLVEGSVQRDVHAASVVRVDRLA
jgi:hypothetical protein